MTRKETLNEAACEIDRKDSGERIHRRGLSSWLSGNQEKKDCGWEKMRRKIEREDEKEKERKREDEKQESWRRVCSLSLCQSLQNFSLSVSVPRRSQSVINGHASLFFNIFVSGYAKFPSLSSFFARFLSSSPSFFFCLFLCTSHSFSLPLSDLQLPASGFISLAQILHLCCKVRVSVSHVVVHSMVKSIVCPLYGKKYCV